MKWYKIVHDSGAWEGAANNQAEALSESGLPETSVITSFSLKGTPGWEDGTPPE